MGSATGTSKGHAKTTRWVLYGGEAGSVPPRKKIKSSATPTGAVNPASHSPEWHFPSIAGRCFGIQQEIDMAKFSYVNNTGADVTVAHPAIMLAIANGGVFGEDFADVFTLTKTPDGSDAEYALSFV